MTISTEAPTAMGKTGIAALLLLVLATAPAWAHRINLFATAEGDRIKGVVTFGGGGKGAGLTVRAKGPDGALLGEAATGPDGGFSLPVGSRMDHLLTVDLDDGHAATFVVKAEEFPVTLPAGDAARIPPGAGDLELAVARQIAPLRAQIAAYEERIRWHDVLGGIGYILGLAGIAFFLLGRRAPRP
ncbi:MAG: hypothetical protein H7841_18305 [Magnetospirillum sp. WYHS-4]